MDDIAQPDAVAELQALLLGGLENPERIQGHCQLVVRDDRGPVEWPILMNLMANGSVHVSNDRLPNPMAALIMPLPTAERIVRDLHFVDYRDPEIIGQVELTGRRELANHLAKALLRPGQDARERLEFVSKRTAPAYGLKNLERVPHPTELEILERIEAGAPFIAVELDGIEALRPWSMAELVAKYADVELRVRSAHERETFGQFVDRVKQAELGDHCSQIVEGANKAYTEGCILPNAMRADFLPLYFSRDDFVEPQIWLGSVPTRFPASSLHRDPLDGFLFQIIGRKHLVLYSPDQAEFVYPMKAWNNYQPCWVRPEAPDLVHFPKFSNARRVDVVLQPGELLVQPAGWFHAVYCMDSPTFSVSYFLKH